MSNKIIDLSTDVSQKTWELMAALSVEHKLTGKEMMEFSFRILSFIAAAIFRCSSDEVQKYPEKFKRVLYAIVDEGIDCSHKLEKVRKQ